MRKYFTTAALLALMAAPLVAQQKGSFEIGAFLRYTDYDKSFGTARNGPNSWGGGGRIGYFLSPRWALEVDGSGNATDVVNFFQGFQSTALTYYPFHLRLNWNQRMGTSPFTFLLGVGPAFNRYGKRVVNEPGFRPQGGGFDWGIAPLAGFRVKLTNWLAFRVDGTLDYIPSPNNGSDEVVNQGAGIAAATPATKNVNLGAQAGLSLLLGTCRRDKDGTTISPSTANVTIGSTASFSATATNCGKPDEVVYSVSGPGSVSPTGVYTSNAAGTATVTACGKQNKLCSTATVNVAPVIVRDTAPTPVARTLSSCELSPATSSPRIDQPVSYTVTLRYSDGTTETMQNVTMTSQGGTVSGNSVSWSTPGSKTITVSCGAGVTGTATADVQQFTIVVRDSVYFMVDSTRIYRTDDQGSLDAVAKVLIEHPDIRLVIDGHTDADATVKYNERLAMNRAIAMKEYLRMRGVPVDRMTIVLRSFSECVPIAPNATAAGRAQNRRAELSEFGNTQPGPANASCSEAGRERKP